MWRHHWYHVTESRFSEYGNFVEFPQRSPGWDVRGDGGERKHYRKMREGKWEKEEKILGTEPREGRGCQKLRMREGRV